MVNSGQYWDINGYILMQSLTIAMFDYQRVLGLVLNNEKGLIWRLVAENMNMSFPLGIWESMFSQLIFMFV